MSALQMSRRRGVRACLVAATATVVAFGTAGCEDTEVLVEPTASTTAPTSTAAIPATGASSTTSVAAIVNQLSSGDSTAALAKLETLPVKGRAPKTGYDRALFGQAWSDDVTVEGGHNGCDTRNDILKRDLTNITIKPGSNDCTVLTGRLDDTYTNIGISFERGEGTSNAVQIDHIVALSDAWQKGAQQLDEQTRRNFANDPRNLQAVNGQANQQKSDSDAASWLPPNKAYRCTYVSRQVEVKAAYGLWVTQAEKDAIVGVLADCGGAGAPIAAAVVPTTTIAPLPPAPAPAPVRQEPAPAPAPAPSGGSAYYKNCDAARAAGAAPIMRGEPGYSSKLDRDNDGVACE